MKSVKNYTIATASTADLPRTYLDEHHIPFIPYSFTVNSEPETDDCREESRAAIYAGMRKGDVLTTSMINEFVYYDFFKELLDRGENVIFLDMSVKMSVSFENCKKAAESIRTEYPGQELYVMDTRCISGGLGLLVMKMVELKEQFRDNYDFEITEFAVTHLAEAGSVHMRRPDTPVMIIKIKAREGRQNGRDNR